MVTKRRTTSTVTLRQGIEVVGRGMVRLVAAWWPCGWVALAYPGHSEGVSGAGGMDRCVCYLGCMVWCSESKLMA